MRRKKYALSLLEVMIALALAGILLSALMSFFYQASKKNVDAQELKRRALPVELMRQRLIYLFAKIEGTPQKFYTLAHPEAEGYALFFTYDYGIDPDPAFCGLVQGMLYLNTRKQLCLVTWASAEAVRQEVFLEGITELFFEFFDVKKTAWEKRWEKKNPLPPMFKMFWATADDPKRGCSSAFFFPEVEAPINYPKTFTVL